MTAGPILFVWNGDAMEPAPGFKRRCDASFVVGERYVLAPWEERSNASHRHEFAWLREAWMNLPAHLADQFPTETHLRKRALIDAGYYTETIIDAGTNAAALRMASHLRHKDDFAYVVVRGPLIVERVAKSQSRRAMKGKEFQESKTAILEIVAGMIGVKPEELTKNAEVAP